MRVLDPAFIARAAEDEYQIEYNIDIHDNKFSTDKAYTASADVTKPSDNRSFEFGQVAYSSNSIVQSVNIKVQDQDKDLYNFLFSTDSTHRIMHYRFKVSIGMKLLHQGIEAASRNIFRGHIDKWNYSTGITQFRGVSIFDQWSIITPAKWSGSCRWRIFKDPDTCGYTGVDPSETCDRSYQQCLLYGNEPNFGGFRWLPAIADRAIKIGEETDIPR